MALPVLSTDNNQEIDTSPIAEAMGTALSVMEPSKAITQSNMSTASPITIEGEWEVIGEDVSDAIKEIGLDGELIEALKENAEKVTDINKGYLSKINSGIKELTDVSVLGFSAIADTNKQILDAIRDDSVVSIQSGDAIKQLEEPAKEDGKRLKAIEDNTGVTADAVKENAENQEGMSAGETSNGEDPNAGIGADAAAAIKDGKKELGMLGTILAVAAGAIHGLVVGAMNYVKLLGKGIGKVFGKILPQSVKTFGANVMQGIKSFGANMINSIKNFGKTISATFKGSVIGKNIMAGITRVKDFFGRIGAFFTRIGKFFQPIFSLFDAITGTTSKVGGIFTKISGFMSKFMGIVSKISTVVSRAFLPLTVVMALFKGITASFDKFAEGDFLGGIGAFLDGIFQFLVVDLLDILYDVVMFIPKLIMRALGLDGLADMFDDFSFSGLWDGFKNGFMDFFRVTLPNMLDGVLSKIGIPSFGFGPIKAFGKTIIPRFDFDGYFPFKEGAEARIQTRNDAKAERDEKKTQEAQALAEKQEQEQIKESSGTDATDESSSQSASYKSDADQLVADAVDVKLDKNTATELGLPQQFKLTDKNDRGQRGIISADGSKVMTLGAGSPMMPVMDSIYDGTVAQQEDATGGAPPASSDGSSVEVDLSGQPNSGETVGQISGDVSDSVINSQNTTNVVTNMSAPSNSTNVNNVKNSTGIIYDGGASSLGGRSALLPN